MIRKVAIEINGSYDDMEYTPEKITDVIRDALKKWSRYTSWETDEIAVTKKD